MDVSPPELHGAQPLLAVVPQSPQVSAGAPPQLAPAAELPGLSETLRSDNNTSSLQCTRPRWDDAATASLLVSAFFSHGLGQLPDGSHLRLAPVLLLLLPEGVPAPLPAAGRAERRPRVLPLGAR